MKLIEQAAARQALQDAESKGGAANAAAGNAERRPLFFQPVNGGPKCLKPGFAFGRSQIVGGQFSMQSSELGRQHFMQVQRGIRR